MLFVFYQEKEERQEKEEDEGCQKSRCGET
jgi:hypothetical protein